MATIVCPTCGRGATVDLYGRYLVRCDQCGTNFLAVITGSKQVRQVSAVCPQCGKSELVSISGDVKVKIKCDQCGHQFIFEGGQET